MSDPVLVTKVTLPTGKVVLLKEANMGHMEKSAQLAGRVAKDNPPYLSMLMQKEMLKMLIVQVDEKKVSMTEKEKINSMFTIREFKMLLEFVGKETGLAEEGNLMTEQVTFGDKSLG